MLGTIILSLVVLLNLLCSLIAIWVAFRRNPPLDRELYKEYATLAALAACRAEHDAKCLSAHTRQDKIDADQYEIIRKAQLATDRSIQDIMRALGRIEGRLNKIMEPS